MGVMDRRMESTGLRRLCSLSRLGLAALFVLFFGGLGVAQAEEVDFRFERMWPQLEQPWYFRFPNDAAVALDGSVYVAVTTNQGARGYPLGRR